MQPKKSFLAKLTHKKQTTPDTFELRYTKPADFSFTAGQFVQWVVPTEEDKFVLRSYSLSSTMADDHIEFFIKILEGGKASQMILEANEGDELEFHGSQGRFVINPENEKPILFVATGTGLAPIMGMIRDELENKKKNTPMHLLFGVRSTQDIFWQERLNELANKYEHFSYQLTLSRPEDHWEGLEGRVTKHLEEHHIDHQYYLCGSLEMVKDVRLMLKEKGVNMKDIHFEIF